MNAKQILDLKENKIYQIREDAVVFEAIEELTKNQVGLLVIKNLKGDISGVLSERDIIRRCVHQKKIRSNSGKGDNYSSRKNSCRRRGG